MKFLAFLFLIGTATAALPLPPEVKVEWGFLPLLNKEGKEQASLFFTSYFQEHPEGEEERPITFCFNGGPGSSSVWLQLGGLGPVRLSEKSIKDPTLFPVLENNPNSLLEFSDLVFIEPLTTGLSRTAQGVDAAPYLSYEGDVDYLAEGMILFLNRFQKWNAPLYMMGESYGAIRIIGLAGKLLDEYRIGTRGLIFVSGVLDLKDIFVSGDSDNPYLFALPTYAILAGKEEGKKPQEIAPLVEAFLENRYQQALFLGDALPKHEIDPLAEELAKWTKLPKEMIVQHRLRIPPHSFRDKFSDDEVIGRFDGTTRSPSPGELPPYFEIDPSLNHLFPVFTQGMHQFLTELGWKGDRESYVVLSQANRNWDFKTKHGIGLFNGVPTLKKLLYLLPALKVVAATGCYDLAIPYYTTKYDLRHLLLDAKTKERVQLGIFEGGHMFYLNPITSNIFLKSLKPLYVQ